MSDIPVHRCTDRCGGGSHYDSSPALPTPEEARAMPGAFTVYRRVDGKKLYDRFDVVDEFVVGDHCDHGPLDGPMEIEEVVVMVPVPVRRFPCHEEDEE